MLAALWGARWGNTLQYVTSRAKQGVLHAEWAKDFCRAELVRLRRKTAALAPADREQVDAISAEVTQAIAASVGAAVDGPHGADLGDIVSRLFAISPADVPKAQSV